VTKKYREEAIDKEEEDISSSPGKNKKRRTFDDVAKRVRVNWKKVRWDMERQTLSQYR
jgi:hypothetical protein